VTVAWHELEEAPLLDKCGGPYPDDPDLLPITWQDAEDRLVAYQIDSTPGLALDKRIHKALGACQELAMKDVGLLRKLFWDHREYNEQMRLLWALWDLIWDFVAEKKKAWPARYQKALGVYELLPDVFVSTAWLLLYGKLAEYPLLERATQVGLQGYIPVDLGEDEHAGKLLIY